MITHEKILHATIIKKMIFVISYDIIINLFNAWSFEVECV